ncbi:DUF2059 domain-containing protein [Marimonas sp. MJW-29]|uniref:DUF2059 domain-containing protein n=1 Tax=Sulfitobacter sediminis TaxID=3234186 RepID=A0ABV3RS28_9RHOB
MLRALLFWPIVLTFTAMGALADARMSVLVDVLRLPEAAQILSDEGLTHTQELNTEMLNGQGGAGFQLQVERIYDPSLMVEMVRSELERELEGALLEEVIAFYASDLGTQIITLENEARRAIQDPDVEEAARARHAELEGNDDERLALIGAYIESGDMISRNVTSAMNSNFQFLKGLAEGGAIEMTEEDMLKDVTSDIDESTQDTTSWLYGYLLLAYSPLSAQDLQEYVAFSRSAAGQALNTALFAGFGKAYEDISYALGRAVALNMTAEEL